LELFWDAVDQLDQALESKVKDVEKYLASRDFKFTEQTTVEELAAVLKEDEDVSKKTEHDGPALYRYVMMFACSRIILKFFVTVP
jgi:hypothetical protein